MPVAISPEIDTAEFGFRLPSCVDNRPMKFEEWDIMWPQTVHVSATPGPWEMERTAGFCRASQPPDWLIDPTCEIRPAMTQLMTTAECHELRRKASVFATTLTKKWPKI